jgi:hypothetical protein
MIDRRRLAGIGAGLILALGLTVEAAPLGPRPSGKDVIARARAYLETYRPALAALVAEEHYTQHSGEVTRSLVSDFALVRADDGMWVGFRDVWQVDGRELPERRARAEQLFGAGRLDWTSARRIIEESARLNLGGGGRDVNTPIIALELLSDARSWCCRVRARRAPGLAAEGLWVIEAEEKVAPTLVRTPERRPLFARAQYLVEADTGAIRRTEFRVGRPDSIDVTLVVTFAKNAVFGQWLPDEMTETAGTRDKGVDRVEGRARYTRWRRFEASSRILESGAREPGARHR